MGDILEKGVEHKVHDPQEIGDERLAADAKEGRKTLTDLSPSAQVKYVNDRLKRLERPFREKMAQIKVNWLRYQGHAFSQVHPTDATRVWNPPATHRKAPTINKIERAVDRYVAQITADQPIIEAVPVSHRQLDRDAAEASSSALRSEWQRLGLFPKLQRVMSFSAVMRSGFWFFQWDTNSGETMPAMKYFDTENGSKVLLPVNSSGEKVEDVSQAAQIKSGNTCVSVMTPANVRWSGGESVHDADEVMVVEVMKLSEVLESMPKTRDAKVRVLLTDNHNRPVDAMEWLTDIKAHELGRAQSRTELDERYIDAVAGQVAEGSNILDESVLVVHYFRRKSRTYPKGFHIITAGNFRVFAGPLRYGVIPVAQFKFLDALFDDLGRSLVDLLKDPQELLDFVNGQILRYLQMLKRRWFVPMYSGVKPRDLLSPTRSIIEYNPQGGAPTPEVQPEIPNSMVTFVDRFRAEFDDQMGLHETSQGKHVPGVGSGRHAEALRSGDETLLSLTRTEIIKGLERSGEIILAMIKREWKTERRVRFLGEDRAYIDRAFKATDFGDTTHVHLKDSTLLMLTPAQRLETIFTWAESGLLKPEELRALAPVGDVAGISLSESKHYQRARRQNTRFLAGPPEKLVRAREEYEANLKQLDSQRMTIEKAAGIGALSGDLVSTSMQAIETQMAAVETIWRTTLDTYAFDHRTWEDRTDIARIHADVHAEALASDKVELFPEWWVEIFEQHTTLEWQLGFPEQQPQPPDPAQAGGGSPPAVDIPTEPAGLSFEQNMPGPVQGSAP